MPSHAATKNAPIRYQARYSGRFQPNALPRNSVPALMPYQRSPRAQMSWKPRRLRIHCASTRLAKTKLRLDEKRGRTTFGDMVPTLVRGELRVKPGAEIHREGGMFSVCAEASAPYERLPRPRT